jgi:hypothetical protein
MKNTLIALLVILLLVGLAFPQRKSDREIDKLIGPVRSVHIKKVTYSESGNSSVEFFTYTYEADGSRTDRPYYSFLDYIAQGGSLDNLENPNKLPEIVGYNTDGSLRYKEVYTFDDKGNMTSKARYNTAGALEYKYVSTYDDRGRKAEDAYYTTGDSWTSKAVYTYDERGSKNSETYYKAGGLIIGKMEFNYDEKGRVIEDVLYDAKGLIERKRIYRYNERGEKTEETCYGEGGRIASRWVSLYKYDEKGNWIEMDWTGTSGGRDVSRQTIYRTITYY